jgi:hypothetical protein
MQPETLVFLTLCVKVLGLWAAAKIFDFVLGATARNCSSCGAKQ